MAIRKIKKDIPEIQPVEVSVPQNTNQGVELKLTQNASIFISTGNSQNQGARPYQEDSFGYSNIIDSKIVTSKGMFAVLSDGMGGLSNGKNVSDYVVKASIAMFDSISPRGNICEQLKKIARYINDSICSKYIVDGKSQAGATMVLAYIFKNRIYWISLGDSRLYLLRGKNMIQMTEDHDYKNQLYRKYIKEGGDIREAEEDPQKDNLVCFVGRNNVSYVDVSAKGYVIRPGDTFVLCSDGIYNAISTDAMRDILVNHDAQTASDRIVSTVVGMNIPGQDNMTVMVIKCDKKTN